MRRTPFVVLLLVLIAAPAARSQDPTPADRPPLRATVEACSTGAAEDARFALFTGSMPARPGTRRMAMRFDLFERTGAGQRWQRLPAPTFGRWERSQPDRAGFVWSKRVERLRPDREYRARVRFRWYDRDGLQTERRRTTPACRQPDLRPNLVVAGVEAVRGDGGRATYRVTVENGGAGSAAASEARLAVGGEEAVRVVGPLAPGARTVLELPGPRCEAGARITVTLDVRDAVEEADEGDNARVEPCGAR